MDQNDIQDLPPEIALLPGLRRLYISQEEDDHQGGGRPPGQQGPGIGGAGAPPLPRPVAEVVRGSVPYK